MIILLFFPLIVFCVNFKIALGMVAGGANLRGLLANDDVTAVSYTHLSLLNEGYTILFTLSRRTPAKGR